MNGGQVNWQAAVGITETNKVKSSAIDPTADYLHAAFTLGATYVGGADLLVAVQTVDGGGGNLKETPFVDVSAISGYNASGDYASDVLGDPWDFSNDADVPPIMTVSSG